MPSVLVSTEALACDAACSTGALNRHSTCAKGGVPSGEPCPRPDAKDTSCTLLPCRALARAEPPPLKPLSKCESHILNAALMLRTTLHSQQVLPKFVHLVLSPLGEPGEKSLSSLPLARQAKSRCVQRSCLPTAAALPESKKWVCTEIASLLSSQQIAPRLNSVSLTTACPPGTADSPEHRGSQVIRLTTGSVACSDCPTRPHAALLHPMP